MKGPDRSRLPEVPASPPFVFPPVARRGLAGGLNVWCVERPELPLISVLLVVPAGSAADPGGLPGLASLTGDMLDEGSGSRSALEIHDAFARIGANLAVEVGADASLVGLTVLSRYFERGVSLLADCVVRPSLKPEDVERVRQLRLNRLAQLRTLAPALADRAFMQMLYEGHPYGHMAIGTEAALSQISLADVTAFHQGAYLPHRTSIVVVGDVRIDALVGVIEGAFGEWMQPDRARHGVSFEAALTEPPAAVDRRLAVVDRPKAAQSELRIGHVGLARSTPDYAALLVFNMVLGGQFVSRLNMKLREEKGFTYGARTSFDFRRGRGPFLFQTSVQTDVTAAAIEDIFAEFQSIRRDRPVTQEELDLAKATLTRGYARNFEASAQLTRALVQLIIHGLPDDHYDTFLGWVNAVDAATVTRVATAYLQPERMLTLIVGDRQSLDPSLRSSGLGTPSELTPA